MIQDDLSNGKTSMNLAITVAIIKGDLLLENITEVALIDVIFQMAENGLYDIVKPRLLQWLLFMAN